MSRLRPLLLLFAASGCSSAGFDLADPSDSAGEFLDGTTGQDVSSVDAVDAGHESASETAPIESGDSSSSSEADASSETLDSGCPLFEHHDAWSGTTWKSCLPSGVVGDASTYSAALLDDEMLHVEAATPSGCSWGSRSSITCGSETCTVRTYSCPALFDGGTASSTWCTTGSMAGWFTGGEGVGRAAICPTTDAHGGWW